MQSHIESLMNGTPHYDSVLRSVHVDFKAGPSSDAFCLESGVAIANIRVSGDWESCKLYVDTSSVDIIHKETGATGFDLLSNGKFIKNQPITLSFTSKLPTDTFSIDYDVVDGRSGSYEYVYRFNQACSHTCTAMKNQSASLAFNYLVEHLTVYSDDRIDEVQLTIAGNKIGHRTLALIKVNNCWSLDCRGAMINFSECDRAQLEFKTGSNNPNTVRVYAQSLNVFSTVQVYA